MKNVVKMTLKIRNVMIWRAVPNIPGAIVRLRIVPAMTLPRRAASAKLAISSGCPGARSGGRMRGTTKARFSSTVPTMMNEKRSVTR